jgi:hypothetical protein
MKRQMAKTHAVNLQLQSEVAKLKDASAAGGTGSAEVKVSSRIESFGFDHDPDKHKRTIRIGGGVDTSYQYNLNRPTRNSNHTGVRIFDGANDNDFSLNLAKVYFDGSAEEAGQAGFRIDLAFGQDPTASGYTTVDHVQQAYIDYIAPIGSGLKITMGKWATPIGYEVMEGWDNVNATRSANFSLPIPFEHTGIMFEYNIMENWGLGLAVVNGLGGDAYGDGNESKGIIFKSGWAPTDWIDWNVNLYVGNEEATFDDTAAGFGQQDDTTFLVNTNIEFRPWENWTFALNANWRLDEDQETRESGFDRGNDLDKDAVTWGVAAYAVWNFSDNWYLALRGEYLCDRDGLLGTGNSDDGVAHPDAGPSNTLWTGTATVGWKIADPMEIRFEYRHDNAEQKAFYGDQVDKNLPGVTRTHDYRSTQNTITMQWVYSF